MRITVGTLPEIFTTIIDINSTDLIIPSINRPLRDKPLYLLTYNSSTSLTYMPNSINVTPIPPQIKRQGSFHEMSLEYGTSW